MLTALPLQPSAQYAPDVGGVFLQTKTAKDIAEICNGKEACNKCPIIYMPPITDYVMRGYAYRYAMLLNHELAHCIGKKPWPGNHPRD